MNKSLLSDVETILVLIYSHCKKQVCLGHFPFVVILVFGITH